MEAASAIMYGDNSVTGERSERWRNIIIHEVAHQWFGNSVTEYDWDDVWLSEGICHLFHLTFLSNMNYGRDAFLKGLQSSKKRVDNFYSLNPNYRIVHDNLKDMRQVTTIQTYQKGSWILHMLRGVVGTDNFWQGIRSYIIKNIKMGMLRRRISEERWKKLQVRTFLFFFSNGCMNPAPCGLWVSGNITLRKSRLKF